MDQLKKAVCDVYASNDRAADAIVCDPELAAWFATQVNNQLPGGEWYQVGDVMRCLLKMRKAGKLGRKTRGGGG